MESNPQSPLVGLGGRDEEEGQAKETTTIDSSLWEGRSVAYRGIYRAKAREVHQYLRQASTSNSRAAPHSHRP